MIPAVIEALSGTFDGMNRRFLTSIPYRSGSVQVWLNGQLKRQDLADGWSEGGGRLILMAAAPEAGDTLSAYYSPIP